MALQDVLWWKKPWGEAFQQRQKTAAEKLDASRSDKAKPDQIRQALTSLGNSIQAEKMDLERNLATLQQLDALDDSTSVTRAIEKQLDTLTARLDSLEVWLKAFFRLMRQHKIPVPRIDEQFEAYKVLRREFFELALDEDRSLYEKVDEVQEKLEQLGETVMTLDLAVTGDSHLSLPSSPQPHLS